MIRNVTKTHKPFAFLALGIIVVIASGAYPSFPQAKNPNDTQLIARVEDKAEGTKATEGSRSSAVPAPRPVSDWTGFYVGGYAGGNWGRATADTSTDSSTGLVMSSIAAIATSGHQKLSPSGFNGGGQGGYNYQNGRFVVGGEADIGGLTGNKTVSTTTTYPCCAPANFTVTQSVKTRWLFTVRPRAGLATKHALLYLTGGLALTGIDYQALFTETVVSAHENGGINKTRAGWTVGGGAEHKLGGKWSVKGEYLFADFRRATTTSTNVTSLSGFVLSSGVFAHSIYLKEHLVRFGVNYHF